MKRIIFFVGIILLSSYAKSGNLVEPQTANVANDTTNYTILTPNNLTKAEEKNSIMVFNSEEIKIEGTFCDIMSKDTLKCIPSTINALSTGVITKIFKKLGGKVKSLVVSYSGKNYVYSLTFIKSKAAKGVEDFVLNGKTVQLLYKGKMYTISATTAGSCKLYIHK
jgi:hypothetical protein